MTQIRVLVTMGVTFVCEIFRTMAILMVLVVTMLVCVLERLMDMIVLVIFGHVQPYTCEHEEPGDA